MKTLWLDIENTILSPVVEGWHASVPMNIVRIQNYIETYKPDRLGIFSFAIHTDHDRNSFKLNWNAYFLNKLGMPFAYIPNIEQIKKHCCSAMRISPDRVEFSNMCDFWSKQLAFELYVQGFSKGNVDEQHHTLLDDAVVHKTFAFPKLNVSGQVLNIDKIRS